MSTVLNRYLQPEVLAHIASQPLQPQGLVIGNLAGAHKSPLSGFAVEFAGHREYTPGDDPKHIDWRVFYTRDKYFVKQYELETNFVCHLLLDISASMRYGEGDTQKMQYAAQLAVTLGYSIVRQSDKVAFGLFDDDVRGFLAPSNSLNQITRMTGALDSAEAVEKTDLSAALSSFVTRMGRRELVFIFSDFFGDLEELEAVIQQMRYKKHEVVLVHVMHHDERHFDMEGMTRFNGLEIPDHLLAQPEDLRRAYLKAVNRFNADLESLALRNRCEYVPIDTSLPMATQMADYMSRRHAMARVR